MDAVSKFQFDAHPKIRIAGWILLFVCFLVLLTVAIHTLLAGNALGIDFHTFWQAARAVAIYDVNPYSDQVAELSQLGAFGEIRLDGNQMGFAYPPYALFPILPLAFLPYAWAQAFWMSLMILIVLGSAIFAAPRGKRLLAVFLFLTPYPIFFGIILGNYSILINSFVLVIFSFLIMRRLPEKWQQAVLGVLMGWITIKPQAVWLFLIVILWISWQKRLRDLLIWFLGSIAVYIFLSFLILPDWPIDWFTSITKYQGYIKYSDPRLAIMLQQFLPAKSLDIIFSLILLVLLISTLWIIFKHSLDSKRQVWLIGWVALVTYLVHPTLFSYVQITLLIPLFLWVFQGQDRGIIWKACFLLLFSISTWLVPFWIGSLINTPFQDEINTLLYMAWLIGLSINLLVRAQKPLTDSSLEKEIPV